MINFHSFSDELVKIAETTGVVPIAQSLPSDADEAFDAIRDAIKSSKASILGHKSIAVPVDRFGDLAERGFKRTRLAVPLPGERIGSPSWRRGQLHAHRADKHYLFHEDEHPPGEGFSNTIRHITREGIPAIRRRLSDRAQFSVGGLS